MHLFLLPIPVVSLSEHTFFPDSTTSLVGSSYCSESRLFVAACDLFPICGLILRLFCGGDPQEVELKFYLSFESVILFFIERLFLYGHTLIPIVVYVVLLNALSVLRWHFLFGSS